MSVSMILSLTEMKTNCDAGDVFATDWDVVLQGATAVVSTLGGFGTQEQMEKLNGDANIEAVDAAKLAGIICIKA
jgi:hypothetical protein